MIHIGSTLLLSAQFGTGLVVAPSNISIEPILINMNIKDLLVHRKTVEVCCDFGAKFSALVLLILQDIWNGGIGHLRHVLPEKSGLSSRHTN